MNRTRKKINRGKQFETKFKKDWYRTVNKLCIRLKDARTTGSWKSKNKDKEKEGVESNSNPCDFICYYYPYVWFVECKEHTGNTLPFAEVRQYREMLKYEGEEGLIMGVIVWMYDHDKVIWIPFSTLKKMIEDGKKSFNIKYLKTGEYRVLEVPGKKLRVFIDTDYSWLVNRSLSELA